MAISSRQAKEFAWSPDLENERGYLHAHLPGSDNPASGRVSGLQITGADGDLVTVENEGSRTGDGEGTQDPYGYENDPLISHDFRPIAVPGVVRGKSALGFMGGSEGSFNGVGSFVDDSNTTVASQAPRVPGSLMVTSRTPSDQGRTPETDQPWTIVVVARFFLGNTGLGSGSGFSPFFDINGPVAPAIPLEDTAMLVAPLRLTKINGGGGADTSLRQLDTQPNPGQWFGVIWRLESDQIRGYSVLTGAELPTNDPFPGSGTYVFPPNTETGQTVVDSVGGRRFSPVGATADRLRQRDFCECHLQEVQTYLRLVDPKDIARWIVASYPGIEGVLAQ